MTESDPFARLHYRRLVAWPERIRREWPFLRSVLGATGSGDGCRVLDLGCGPAEHARFLVEQGCSVVGVDRSAAMLEQAREEPLPIGLELVEGELGELADLVSGPFGGAICLGNTLPHLRSEEELGRFFTALRRVLAPGAPVVFQLLNYDRIERRNERALPVNVRPGEEDELVFLRLMTQGPDRTVDFVPATLRLRPDGDPPLELLRARRVRLRGWRWSELGERLREHGFADVTAQGSFDAEPFDPLASRDLVVVAR